MKKHDLETLLRLDSKVNTSVVSYIYECPACKQERRYAYPPLGWGVFCDGKDFRTQKRSDSFLKVWGRKILRKLKLLDVDIKQFGTQQHTSNLAKHYNTDIRDLPFSVRSVTLQEGEMFSYRIMSTIWMLEDENVIERIEGAKYKATPLGSIVLTQLPQN